MKQIAAVLVAIGFLFSGCSSLPEKHGMVTPEEKVLSRADGLSSRPDWIHETMPFSIKDGTVTNLGMTTVPGDSRVEAAYRIASNNAKAGIATSIEQRLSFIFQNAEENSGFDATQARYIGAEASELTSSSLRTSNQYYEKVFAVNEHGVGSTFYRVYSLVSIPEQEFKRAIGEAIKKQSAHGKLSKSFAKKVDEHWDKFVEAQPAREAASAE